jgi:hypothetical protein
MNFNELADGISPLDERNRRYPKASAPAASIGQACCHILAKRSGLKAESGMNSVT